MKTTEAGYHIREIEKGVYGEPSKIQEELDELKDAIEQNNKIMIGVELSDLYGAILAVADKYGYSMFDVQKMAQATQRAFRNGYRR